MRARKTKPTPLPKEQRLHRVGVRLTPDDQKTLAELRAARPQPCSDVAAIRHALRAALWLERHRANGSKLTVTSPDGRTRTLVFV